MRVFRPIATIGWSLSIGLHVGAASLMLRMAPEQRADPRHSQVSFSVLPATKAITVPPPAPPSTLQAPIRRIVRAVASAPKPANTSKPSPAPPPAELTGVTLTGGDGAAWSSVTGNGQTMDAAILATVVAPPQIIQQPANAPAARVPTPKAEREFVAVKDLSTKPIPPVLDSLLLRNYPTAAKRQGLAGKAVVLACIGTDGIVRETSIFSESSAGFGAACQRTLLGSRWSAPRDRSGKPVNTRIYYKCDFRVDG